MKPIYQAEINAQTLELEYSSLLMQQIFERIRSYIHPYASPARNTDYADFSPTITFVENEEPFRDETLSYIDNLINANILVEFSLYAVFFTDSRLNTQC